MTSIQWDVGQLSYFCEDLMYPAKSMAVERSAFSHKIILISVEAGRQTQEYFPPSCLKGTDYKLNQIV